ncbi:MAG: phosphoribosyltransferase family protein [Fimbriimonadaceae bacterium]
MQWLRKVCKEAVSWLYPDRCELCYRIARPSLCDECRSEMAQLDDAVHPYFAGYPLDLSASLYLFEGRAAEAVKRLKYSRATGLARPMSDILAASLDSLSLPEFHVYVPVPIHWQRQNGRGFNQAELLCESFPQGQVVPDLLARTRATRPQVGLTRDQRLRNLKGAFKASPDTNGLRVLLIDDVTTSGGTATACAEALKAEGAAFVGILTFCGE